MKRMEREEVMKRMEDAVRELGGVWPSNEPAETELYQFSNGQYAAGLAGWADRYIGNHWEFDVCTDRLRNEPSFEDHPDAKCFVQDAHGLWSKNTSTDAVRPSESTWYSAVGGWWCSVGRGEVIGDWKQTLRLRPEEKEVEGNSLRKISRWAAELDTENHEVAALKEQLDREGVPRTSNPLPFFPEGNPYSLWGRVKRFKEMAIEAEFIKRVNELQSAPDNNWHQRGEFPPVGTVCEYKLSDCHWYAVEITAVTKHGLCFVRLGTSDEKYVPSSSKFRPLQTERERWLGAARKAVIEAPTFDDALGSIYDAGLAKMPEEK